MAYIHVTDIMLIMHLHAIHHDFHNKHNNVKLQIHWKGVLEYMLCSLQVSNIQKLKHKTEYEISEQ